MRKGAAVRVRPVGSRGWLSGFLAPFGRYLSRAECGVLRGRLVGFFGFLSVSVPVGCACFRLSVGGFAFLWVLCAVGLLCLLVCSLFVVFGVRSVGLLSGCRGFSVFRVWCSSSSSWGYWGSLCSGFFVSWCSPFGCSSGLWGGRGRACVEGAGCFVEEGVLAVRVGWGRSGWFAGWGFWVRSCSTARGLLRAARARRKGRAGEVMV